MIPRLLVLLAALLTASSASALFTSGSAWALTLPDHPDGRVSDYAGALSPSARANLEQQIAQATAGRSLQVAVAIFPSLDGGAIEDTSIRLAEKWKIGGRSSDDGVLITLFVADRKMRIEVGYGLEGVLPDVAAKRIVADVMAPRLRAGDMEGGLRDGVAAVLQAAGAGDGTTATTAPALAQPPPRIHVPGWLVLAVIGVVVLFVIAAARSGRTHGGYSGGSSGWAQQAGTSLLWNILWSILFSGGGRGGRGGGSWGGGGGGGGFSGGGGSFGGGGASGSW